MALLMVAGSLLIHTPAAHPLSSLHRAVDPALALAVPVVRHPIEGGTLGFLERALPAEARERERVSERVREWESGRVS